MKTKLFLFVILFLTAAHIKAQDIIYFRNGEKDSVRIEKVTPDEVIYKKYRQPDGLTYRIQKTEVVLVQYEDGSMEIFDKKPVPQKMKPLVRKKRREDSAFVASLGYNMLGINLLNTINGNVNVYYEKLFKDRKAGLKLTANIGLIRPKDFPDVIKYQRKYTFGAEFNFYPTGQGKVKYFIGPAIRFGVLGLYHNLYYDGLKQAYINAPAEFGYFGLFFNNGIMVNATKNFFITFQGAVGVGRFKYLNYNEHTKPNRLFVERDGIIAVNLGYRF